MFRNFFAVALLFSITASASSDFKTWVKHSAFAPTQNPGPLVSINNPEIRVTFETASNSVKILQIDEGLQVSDSKAFFENVIVPSLNASLRTSPMAEAGIYTLTLTPKKIEVQIVGDALDEKIQDPNNGQVYTTYTYVVKSKGALDKVIFYLNSGKTLVKVTGIKFISYLDGKPPRSREMFQCY